MTQITHPVQCGGRIWTLPVEVLRPDGRTTNMSKNPFVVTPSGVIAHEVRWQYQMHPAVPGHAADICHGAHRGTEKSCHECTPIHTDDAVGRARPLGALIPWLPKNCRAGSPRGFPADVDGTADY